MVSKVTADELLPRLPLDERRWIEVFRDRLRAMLGPRLRDVRLFGSKATGEDHEESDIDVLVLVQDLDSETKWAIVDLAASISTCLSPLVADFDRYHAPISRASGLYKEMRLHSVRL